MSSPHPLARALRFPESSPRLRALAHSLLLAAALLPGVQASQPQAPSPPPPAPCADAAPGERCVVLDPAPLGVAAAPTELRYAPERLLRPVSADGLGEVSERSLAVRLVLSEVGPDRLVNSSNGLAEAIGVLATVRNRLDRDAADPLRLEHYQPYPGCGEGGTFTSCANPQQFLGLATRRALDPGRSLEADALYEATDRAVLAWELLRSGAVADPTGGAVAFVHRCGGRAYGAPSTSCDEPEERSGGVEAHSGPLVFKAPASRHPGGWYRLRVSAVVDYAPTGG